MFVNARHRAVEARFIRLVDDASLPRPDRVEFAREAVTFFWDGPKTAVVVDLDRDSDDLQSTRSSRRSA